MKQQDVILVPLAEGFEEIEAVTIVDVLRRAGLPVTLAGLTPGPITGAHGMVLGADCSLDDVERGSLRAIVLPGGMPGTTNLMEDERVLDLVRYLHAEGRTTAAICAAPMVLEAAGVLGRGPATSYPSVRGNLGLAEVLDSPRVVRAGTLMTSQGPGTAMEFSLALVADLVGPQAAQDLAADLLVQK